MKKASTGGYRAQGHMRAARFEYLAPARAATGKKRVRNAARRPRQRLEGTLMLMQLVQGSYKRARAMSRRRRWPGSGRGVHGRELPVLCVSRCVAFVNAPGDRADTPETPTPTNQGMMKMKATAQQKRKVQSTDSR